MPANPLPQVATSWHEPALPAFSALCDEALRRCSSQHGLPVTPSDEMQLRAWQLCWLALDAASAPANNLPEIADSQGWPPELVQQLRSTSALPKLNTQTWQELRRARDQQLFAALAPQQPAAAESAANEALAGELKDAFARVGVERLRAWVTPAVTAAMTRWLSAGLLAMESLAWSDDETEATALELIVFVQATLQREHGAAAPAEALVQSEPQQPAAAAPQPAAAAPQPAAAAPQPAAAAPQPAAAAPQPAAAAPQPAAAAPQPAAAAPQPADSAASRVDTYQAAPGPRWIKPQTIAQVAGVVAVAALLMLMLKPRDATPPTADATPHVVTPAAPVAAPEPAMVAPEPAAPVQPSIKPKAIATANPRYKNVAAAKRAHTAKKIDDAAYAAAIAELEALRTAKLAKEEADLRSGKLSQRDYQRKVDAINKKLGFESH